MKTRYKIPIIAISTLLGILFIPLIASNIYCDYLADSCTSRITGVGPGGVYLPAEWGTKENCYVANDDGTMKPCLIDIAQINWPFPPRIPEHESNCDEVCPDDDISIDQKNDVPSRFSDEITEIINPEHESLKYRNTPQVIGDTYLSKNVQQWQNAWQFELETEYQNYGDDFYTELGRLLMKNEMQHQMNDLGIVNADEDYEVFSGGMLTSLPPHIGFSAVIYATDGNYYRLEGGTLANQVNYYRTTQLQFPDITEELSIESILDKPQLITIISEDGNKARQEPSTLVIHVDDNTVEFFNNTPDVIRVQDSGSGRVGEENTLGWMGPTILPYQKTAVTFDESGLIEWDARKAPSLEDPLWWQTHAGGYIVVLSDDIDDFSRDDKARIAQKMLHNSDIPIIASGAGNAEKVLKVSLDPAVTETIPNAEEYYLQRAYQLIPFNVEIIVDE